MFRLSKFRFVAILTAVFFALSLVTPLPAKAQPFAVKITNSQQVPPALVYERPPTLNPVGNQTIDVGKTLQIQLTAVAANPNPLFFTAEPLPLFKNATLDSKTGLFVFNPDLSQVGQIPITFVVYDRHLRASEKITITVKRPTGTTTELSGRLLDTNDYVKSKKITPVVNATVSILGSTKKVKSDNQGNFKLSGIPSGKQIFDIDTSTANKAPNGAPYAGFREEIHIIPNVPNVVSRPFFLPRIDTSSLTKVDPTKTTTVNNSTLKITMTVPPHTAKNPTGGDFTGQLSISEVPNGLAPAAMPAEFQPGLLITVQPVGVTFADPVPITFPNTDNLKANSVVDLWSLDAKAGIFVPVGAGKVRANGSAIDITSGGIRAADWHFVGSPQLLGDKSGPNPDIKKKELCNNCEGQAWGSSNTLSSGNLTIDHILPSYRSLGEERALRFVYHSLAADPRPVVSANTTIRKELAVPGLISARLDVGNVMVGSEVYTATSGLNENIDETIRQIVQFDAGAYKTGRYPYELWVTNHYPSSSFSSVIDGHVLVNNESKSVFGAGWTLDGLQKLYIKNTGDIILTEGDGSVIYYSGAGGLSRPTSLNQPGDKVVTGDFNNDGNDDIAAVKANRNLCTFLGKGNGTFGSANLRQISYSAIDGFFTGDFNNDGKLDVTFGTQTSSVVLLSLGDGKGNLAAPAAINVGSQYAVVRGVGDFDRDNNLDILVATSTTSGKFAVLFGNGRGGFSQSNFTTPSAGRSYAVADFNRDTFLDIVYHNSVDLYFIAGNGKGSFAAARKVYTNTSLGTDMAVGDFNGDMTPDLAVTTSNGVGKQDGALILLADGFGGFIERTTVLTGDTPANVRAADVNNDRVLDLIVGHQLDKNFAVLIGDATGKFFPPFIYDAGGAVTDFATADFNKDGAVDLAEVANNPSIFLAVLLGDPSSLGKFKSPTADYSTILKNQNGTYTRTLKDGTIVNFNSKGLQTTRVDRNGNTTTYNYDTSDRLFEIIDPAGQKTTLTYTGGYLDTVKDPMGRITTFVHDANGDLREIIDPDNQKRRFHYTVSHRLFWQYSKRNHYTVYQYNFTGRNIQVRRPDNSSRKMNPAQIIGLVDVTSGLGTKTNPAPVVRPAQAISTYTDGNNNVSKFTTDSFGATTILKDPKDRTTTIKRNDNGEPLEITYPGRNGVKFVYDETNFNPRSRGNLLEIRRKPNMTKADDDKVDLVTKITYENKFNQIKTITDPKGFVTTNTYDYELPTTDPRYGTKGNLVKIEYPKVKKGIPTVWFRYNAEGQIAEVQDPNAIITKYDYFPKASTLANLKSITEDPTGIGALTQLTYDTYGNIKTITDARTNTTNLQYDNMNRLKQETNPLTFKTTYGYDESGNLKSIRRQADTTATVWQETRFAYTPLEQLETITDPLSRVTSFKYDPNENLQWILDAENRKTTYEYDERNLLFKVKDANSPQGVTQYLYDLNGNLMWIIDANNNRTSYAFDFFDRLQGKQIAGKDAFIYGYDKNSNLKKLTTPSTKTMEYDYDELNRLTTKRFPSTTALNTTYDYDLGSRLESAVNNASDAKFTYDKLNRIKTTTQKLGGKSYTLTYDYDKVDNRRLLQYPSGKKIEYVHDANNRLQDIKLGGNLLTRYLYDPLDRRWIKAMTTTNIQGAIYGFDLANQLRAMTNTVVPTGLISQHDYGYDKVFNRKTYKITDPAGSKAFTYAYNNIYELTGVSGAQSHVFQYDKVHNRTSVNSTTYKPNTLNQYTQVGSQTYIYDGNGNLANDGTNSYVYDEENRLTDVTNAKTKYEYDGFNRRVKKTINSAVTYFIYDGDEAIEERDGSGNLTASYIYGDDIDEVISMERGGKTYYYHYDGLGSVTEITDAAGKVIEKYSYDVYGKPSSTSSIGNPYYFTGRRLDSESGIYYYRARMYDPKIGRFLQRDPLGYFDSMNLYAYVYNNPINYTDPYGYGYFYKRKLGGKNWIPGVSDNNAWLDNTNQEYSHEHYFYDNGSNIGYGPQGVYYNESVTKETWYKSSDYFDDDIMREAAKNISPFWRGADYCVSQTVMDAGSYMGLTEACGITHNCQSFAEALRDEYERIKKKRE